jgi:transcription elongation factor SPT6
VGPYKPEIDEDDDDWDASKGIRVMGLAYSPDHEQASFACILSPDGEVQDHLRLPYIMKRAFNDDVKAKRNADFNHIRNFMISKRPHVVVIGAESRDALWLVRDIKAVIDQLVVDEQFPQIQVEILDNHLARIYANSIKGEVIYKYLAF